jgi:predicted Fe-S protein YdhL (DUF1289 family)
MHSRRGFDADAIAIPIHISSFCDKFGASKTAFMTTESPCIDICTTDDTGMCLGCFRTLKEIGDWPYLSEQEKKKIIAQLAGRRLKKQESDQ